VTTVSDPELDSVAWDLEELVDGEGAAGVDRLLDEATRRADDFAAAHADELLSADGLDFARHYLRAARRYRPHLLT